jgi:nicotinamidase-related amidase
LCTISGRNGTALLVIDVQVDVVAGCFDEAQRTANIADLVRHARTNSVPVIWVQHNDEELTVGSPGWQLVEQLVPLKDESIIHKNYRSSFEATNLDEVLAELNVGHLIMCGSQSNYCVRNTLHAAIERGYDVTLVADAHTTCDEYVDNQVIPGANIVNELNQVSGHYELPGRVLQTKLTSEILA